MQKKFIFFSISLKNHVPNLQNCFEKCFSDLICKWKDMQILLCILILNQTFFNIKYYVLYFNKHLFIFRKQCQHYSFCNLEDEEKIHLFANCCKSKTLWNSLRQFFKDTIDMPQLISQSAIFGIVQIDREFFLIFEYA